MSLVVFCQCQSAFAQTKYPAPAAAPTDWRGGATPESKKLQQTAPPVPSGGGGSVESNRMQPQGLTLPNLQAQKALTDVVDEATKTSGAIFEGSDEIKVKAPILTALIQLSRNFDPYELDTTYQQEISLKEVLQKALANNLDIKIAWTGMNVSRWGYYGAFGGFLPSISTSTTFEALDGHYVSPGSVIIPLKNHFLNNSNGFNYYLYKGGSILYNLKEQKHNFVAAKYELKGTTYDILLNATKLYYDLVLQDVLLQIQIKAVQVSKALVQVQQDMYEKGTNTKLDLLQALYQLSHDRQDLIKQQVNRRQAAVKLASALNLDPNIDLTLRHRQILKTTLIDFNMMPNRLLQIAVDNRPELKKFENLRQAALDQIQVARASLLPSIQAKGTIINTAAKAEALSKSSNGGNQQTPIAFAGGVGIGAVSEGGAPSGTSTGGKQRNTASSLFIIGLEAKWDFGGLGLTEYGTIQQAKYNARLVQFEFNKELQTIYQDVHTSYLSVLQADNLIKETNDAVAYAEEQLRVAEIRLKDGIGTYLDVINAQKSYTDALISKAHALVDYNVAEATLLHAIGRMTVDTTTTASPIRG